jgi:hypothetical protein
MPRRSSADRRHGRGFDPSDVAQDRLGIRGSIVARMAAVGGRARVKTGPEGRACCWSGRAMTTSPCGRSGLRIALSLLAVAFTAYLAVGALVWTSAPDHPIVQVGAVALYLLTTWICIFWNSRGEDAADPLRSDSTRSACGWGRDVSFRRGRRSRPRRRRDRAERQLVRRGALGGSTATPPGASARSARSV